jgi:hypothetical protein
VNRGARVPYIGPARRNINSLKSCVIHLVSREVRIEPSQASGLVSNNAPHPSQ